MLKVDAHVRLTFVFVCVLLVVLLWGSTPVYAAINEQIDFYGTLQNDSGDNLTGTYDIVFRFYSASSGGTLLGTNTHTSANGNAVDVRNGKFAVVLGSGTGNSLTGIDFDSPAIYVGLTIGSDSEMVPRERLTAAPYAFNADRLDGYHANQLLRYNATGSMTTSSAETILSLRQNGAGKIFTLFGGATEMLSVLANGNVGIGSTTPGRTLSIQGDAQFTGGLYDSFGTAGTLGMVLQTTGTTTRWVATSTLGISGGSGGSLFTDGGATTYLTAVGDNLAIGSTSATDKLSIAGNINLDGNYGLSLNGIRYFYGTTDTDNIQIGRDAGLSFDALNTDNVSIGFEAGKYSSTTNADYNVMVGYQAGSHNTGPSNVLLGYGAGDYNSEYGNIMLGVYAGAQNLGASNILIGESSGQNNSSFSNIFIGESAGQNNTNNSNYFIGINAGKNNTGTVNTIIGYNAGVDNTGDNNVSLGSNTGYANQGNNNNFLGVQAGFDNRGSYNNLIGESAGYSNRGSYNNSVGYLAAYNNNGAYNDIIGYQAGANLQASNTVAIGANALSGGAVFTNGAGNFQALNNVALGYRAGYSAQTGADNNVFIGYQAGSNVTTGKNNIVLGYDLSLRSPTQSNTLTIGNLLYATGLTATGTATSTGRFGIGTTTPSAQLTTVGTVRLAAFGSGALQSDALGNISVSSDERLKDIQGEFTKGIDVLMAIDPIQYKWKASTGYDTANVYTGFSAQNVQAVLPEAVGKSSDGYLTLSDRPILATVINAVKEIYAWMHMTDSRVHTLEAQVESMQAEIESLKAGNDQVSPAPAPAPAPAPEQPTDSEDTTDTTDATSTIPTEPDATPLTPDTPDIPVTPEVVNDVSVPPSDITIPSS